MPKLQNQLPKKCRDRNQCFSWHKGKRIYHGVWGSPAAEESYRRFIANLLDNPTLLQRRVGKRDGTDGDDILVVELCDAFLLYAKARLAENEYQIVQRAIGFLVELFGSMPGNEITPKKLRTVRDQMVRAGTLCRKTINKLVGKIVRMFVWGCEEELVCSSTAGALKMIKPLQKGEPGTFDHAKRRNVTDEAIMRTLPFLSKTVGAMVKLQRLLGCRPAEVFNMRVGEIIKETGSELWYYVPGHHKTERYYEEVDEDKIIPLGKPEQVLLTPFLEGKRHEEAVFSPKEAVRECKERQRAARKSKLTPSQRERDRLRAESPTNNVGRFYDRGSYRTAVQRAIRRANQNLSAGEKPIPMWSPYSLRHQAATALGRGKDGDKAAQALLDHSSLSTTKRYIHERLERRKELALFRVDPFAAPPEAGKSAEPGT